jgi:uncharacterized protein YjbI with pentapeptide repeats
MADQSHLDLLQQDVEAWNSWRERNPTIVEPNLSKAMLYKANLSGADLSRANLFEARLSKANLSGTDLSNSLLNNVGLYEANLSGANFSGAQLNEAKLWHADLSYAILSNSRLWRSELYRANLYRANLSDADLTRVALVETNLTETTLTGCNVYGISAWNLKLEGAKQHNLNISDFGEPAIMVDNLEMAQFIYLLLNNERIRQVIDTITSKVVLILGRFTPERKVVLDTIRDHLRQHDYLPVLFDFDKPAGRDLTETISTLAHMARFIIADITDAKSIPQELQTIIPSLPSVPVQPLLLASQHEYGMFEHFKRYPWVLEVYLYAHPHEVLRSLEAKVIAPAEAKRIELSP